MKYTVLFNPLAGNQTGTERAEQIRDFLPDADLSFHSMTDIPDYEAFFASQDADASIIVAGGDGTLNRFINDALPFCRERSVLYYAVGSGNDFLHDIGHSPEDGPVCIDCYLKSLPQVTVHGRTYAFLNGIGYGIDGYCCEVGDELRSRSPQKPINYTIIAIKGLLFHYKPTNAVITVDGNTHRFKKVWLAPTMNGRFYGGGMMPTPNQNRLGGEHTVSTLVFHGSGKLKTLMVFPSIFKGEHIRKTKVTQVLTGHQITVEFDRPTALQIDGETVLNVTSYSVSSYAAVSSAQRTQEDEFCLV